MAEIGAYDAKTHLPALLDRVEAGETLTITRRGKAVARLVPVEPARLTVREAIEAIKSLRKSMPRVTAKEIIVMRDEDRRV